MSSEVEVRVVSPKDWRRVAESFADYNYENCFSYASAIASRSGSSSVLLQVQSASDTIGAAAVRIKTIPLIGRGIAYISSGPLYRSVAGNEDHQSSLRRLLSALRAKLVDEDGHILMVRLPIVPARECSALRDVFAASGFSPTPLVRDYKTVLIDLAPPEEALRARLHSKWRGRLNQSIKAGLSVEIGTEREFHGRFHAIFDAMKEVKSFDAGLGPRFFSDLDEHDAGLVVLIARKDGEDAGGLVLSILGDTAVDLFAATNNTGRDTRAGYYLRWVAMQYLKKRGCRWYDLGGIDATDNYGGFEFKSRMGGEIVDAVGPFKIAPRGVIAALMDNALTLRQRMARRHVPPQMPQQTQE